MNTNENVTLIDGVFTPEEAKEVLLTLLNHKINFHRMRNFSSEERFGKPDTASLKRLTELHKSRDQVISILDDATASGHTLEIASLVSIRKGTKMEKPAQKEISAAAVPSAQHDIIQLW